MSIISEINNYFRISFSYNLSIEEAEKILELPENYSSEQVKKHYREKAVLFHPDRSTSPDANENMAKINAAYAKLKNHSKEKLLKYSDDEKTYVINYILNHKKDNDNFEDIANYISRLRPTAYHAISKKRYTERLNDDISKQVLIHLFNELYAYNYNSFRELVNQIILRSNNKNKIDLVANKIDSFYKQAMDSDYPQEDSEYLIQSFISNPSKKTLLECIEYIPELLKYKNFNVLFDSSALRPLLELAEEGNEIAKSIVEKEKQTAKLLMESELDRLKNISMYRNVLIWFLDYEKLATEQEVIDAGRKIIQKIYFDKEADEDKKELILNNLQNKMPQEELIGLIEKLKYRLNNTLPSQVNIDEDLSSQDIMNSKKIELVDLHKKLSHMLNHHGFLTIEELRHIIDISGTRGKDMLRKIVFEISGKSFVLDENMKPMNISLREFNWSEDSSRIRINPPYRMIEENRKKWHEIFEDFKIIPLLKY